MNDSFILFVQSSKHRGCFEIAHGWLRIVFFLFNARTETNLTLIVAVAGRNKDVISVSALKFDAGIICATILCCYLFSGVVIFKTEDEAFGGTSNT